MRPEDVSAPASDNVSWKDTACHFTQAHIKKDSGGREEKTACHLFALIQDRTKGGTGRLCECVCVLLMVLVCPACKQTMGKNISNISCFKYTKTHRQTHMKTGTVLSHLTCI